MSDKLYRIGCDPYTPTYPNYVRAEDAERYAALGRLAAKHFQDAEVYLRWAGGERGMKANGGFRERPDRQALAYIELRDAVRAIEKADAQSAVPD